MLGDLFEISEKNGRFFVKPVDRRASYIIECRTKAEAVRVVLQAKTPLSDPQLFQEKGQLTSGETIYTCL